MTDYTKLKYTELKKLLRDRDLSSTGKKADLIKRLEDDDNKYKPKPGEITVFVKTLMGSFYTINIDKTLPVSELKERIREKNGASPHKQVLRYISWCDSPEMGDIVYQDGRVAKQLKDDESLLEQGVYHESTIDLTVRLI